MLTSFIRNTFRKQEKICNQNQIDRLFKEGRTLKSGQFRLLFIETDVSRPYPLQLLIAVSKKNLHHAVDRNRMKRLIREAYRMGKHTIMETYLKAGKNCDIAIIFTGKQCVSFTETETAINELLDRLISKHEKNSE
jgi:ribonuclease P protein component